VYLIACIELEGRYSYRVTLCCNDRTEWLTEEVGIGRALRQVHNIPLWTCRFHGWMNSRRPQIVVHMKVVSCSSFNFVAIMWRLPTCFHHVCAKISIANYIEIWLKVTVALSSRRIIATTISWKMKHNCIWIQLLLLNTISCAWTWIASSPVVGME